MLHESNEPFAGHNRQSLILLVYWSHFVGSQQGAMSGALLLLVRGLFIRQGMQADIKSEFIALSLLMHLASDQTEGKHKFLIDLFAF